MVPFENVSAGDVVLTRAGPRKFLAARMTSDSAEILELITKSGKRLLATKRT
jgi:hypothetical protein